MRIEWRREEAAPVDDGGEEVLVDSIRSEIAASGPMTFARFMERALYEPDHGYYATATTRPTRNGDFLTAPELHPIFGQTIALQVDEMWRRMGRPSGFVVREYGAGTGALFLAVLDGLIRAESPLASSVTYEPIELPAQTTLIRDRLAADGRAGVVREHSQNESFVGCVIANEFLDALPVHRVIQSNGTLREIHVEWRDERFVELAGPLTDQRLADWFTEAGVELADGQRAEVNLAMLDWIATLGRELARGYAILIDYGTGSRELYGPSRHNGTIRAFVGQHVSGDVLSGVGRRDITASVDLDALERAARALGFDVLGRRRAAEFLLAAGLDEIYQRARAEADQDWDAALLLRSAVQRLIDPNALGGYQVVILGREVDPSPPLRGLAELRT
jgi:SAM-dependent MidA family methyltransferase